MWHNTQRKIIKSFFLLRNLLVDFIIIIQHSLHSFLVAKIKQFMCTKKLQPLNRTYISLSGLFSGFLHLSNFLSNNFCWFLSGIASTIFTIERIPSKN